MELMAKKKIVKLRMGLYWNQNLLPQCSLYRKRTNLIDTFSLVREDFCDGPSLALRYKLINTLLYKIINLKF
jgi:hypothetical protein